jgi:uncharacterized protein (DUF1810 family)
MPMNDSYDLDRFVRAQEPLFEAVIAELTAGRKQSHWIWFIFPQLQGLGSSPMAQRFGIRSLAEAHAYLQHPLLGERLRRCTQLVNQITGRSAAQIFGYPDDLKFRSCMSLFRRAAEGAGFEDAGNAVFGEALRRFFAGEEDALTRERLS